MPAGDHSLEALANSHALVKRAKMKVEASATRAGAAVAPPMAPASSGIVVNEEGESASDAWVRGWPSERNGDETRRARPD